ncbi:protease [Cupriavidus sp. 30B13]|uniref:protease n=1 Tax=Cupriavidus sp. 30B13 TaxID=3384241 RepID=UPI003B918380
MSEATTGQTQTDPGATPADGAAATTVLTDGAAAPSGEQQAASQTEAQPGDGQQPGAKEGEAKPKEGEETPAAKAPEQYEDFAAPEGVEMDAELTGELKTIAKELDLTQEQAQKLADLGAKHAQKITGAQTEALARARETWAEEARSDKEFGGAEFDANIAVAKTAVDQFVSPALKTMLNETGLGNHPEFIRTFVKIGKAISQDRFVGGKGAAAPRSTADRLYSKTTSK